MYMEIVKFNEFVIKLLEAKFEQSFIQSDLSPRHYSFSSQDFDFSFPVGLRDAESENSLRDKITRWLNRSSEEIKVNGHYLFDSTGNMYLP